MKYKCSYILTSRVVYEEMVKLSAEGIKSLRDAPSLVQCLREAGSSLNERALAFLQEQQISGEDFLELTYNELDSRGLELGPIKSILRTIDKIKKTEQINNDIDESLIQSFEKFSVKEIAPETHKGHSESTLKQLCERKYSKKTTDYIIGESLVRKQIIKSFLVCVGLKRLITTAYQLLCILRMRKG